MLKAHNIGTDMVADQALELLSIEGGAVMSEYEYSAPKLEASSGNIKQQTIQPSGTGALTMDDVRKMTPEQVNRRRDEVGDVTAIEPIAVGKSVKERARLRRRYGPGRWRKLKGIASGWHRNGKI